ncbi:MAG: activator of HSP90 ATPase [Gammaproteobacteria bacterium]|jgi:activator of HSP90 ATPase
MLRTINQEIIVNASPEKVYKTLSDPSQFGLFTNTKAEIDLNPGGLISLFDGMITGLTIQAIENVRLVQVWRVEIWADGDYSLVKFDINGDDVQTTINFEHTGFPKDAKEHLESGWHKMYWDPLKSYLG